MTKFNILAIFDKYREKPFKYKVFPKMNIRPHKNGFLNQIFAAMGLFDLPMA
jgi:hypothetical protein